VAISYKNPRSLNQSDEFSGNSIKEGNIFLENKDYTNIRKPGGYKCIKKENMIFV
jgi:hypothetical protein